MIFFLFQYSVIWEYLSMPIMLFTLFGGFATHIYLAAWVYEDLNRRYATHLNWPIFNFFTGIVGVLIYIAVRREFVDHIQVFEGKVIRVKSNTRDKFGVRDQNIYSFTLKAPSRAEWHCYTDSEKSLEVRRNDDVRVVGTNLKEKMKVRIFALFNFTQEQFINFDKGMSNKRGVRLRILLLLLEILIIIGGISVLIIFLEGSQDYIMLLYYGVYTIGFYFLIILTNKKYRQETYQKADKILL